MSERLRMDPMTDAELASFIEDSRQVYIEDRVTNGGEDPREAAEIEERQYADYFPGGRPAVGHQLFTGQNAATGQTIGILWMFESRNVAGTRAFIYDIEVKKDLRGQGWGRELMTYAELWARERGAREIALNVFGGNTVARGLYASLDYRERSVAMAKVLTP